MRESIVHRVHHNPITQLPIVICMLPCTIFFWSFFLTNKQLGGNQKIKSLGVGVGAKKHWLSSVRIRGNLYPTVGPTFPKNGF
jgi:hypothetical protein